MYSSIVVSDTLYTTARSRIMLQGWCSRAELCRVHELDGAVADAMMARFVSEGVALPTSDPAVLSVVSTVLHRL